MGLSKFFKAASQTGFAPEDARETVYGTLSDCMFVCETDQQCAGLIYDETSESCVWYQGGGSGARPALDTSASVRAFQRDNEREDEGICSFNVQCKNKICTNIGTCGEASPPISLSLQPLLPPL